MEKIEAQVEGHTYIRIRGKYGRPARFMDVVLFTAEEFEALLPEDKRGCRPLVMTDKFWTDLHFYKNEPIKPLELTQTTP